MKQITSPSLGFLDTRFVNVTGDTMTGDLNMTADIIPTSDSARDLGSSTYYWANAYLDKTYFGSADNHISFDGTFLNFNVKSFRLVDGTTGNTDAIFLVPSSSLIRIGSTNAVDVSLERNFSSRIKLKNAYVECQVHTIPFTDSGLDLGISSLYWRNTYTDNLYLNSTAFFKGSGAGIAELDGNLKIEPPSNSTTTLQVNQADGTNVLNVDTTNARVGIGTDAPAAKLEVNAATTSTTGAIFQTTDDNATNNLTEWQKADGTVLANVSSTGFLTVQTGGLTASYPTAGMVAVLRNSATSAYVYAENQSQDGAAGFFAINDDGRTAGTGVIYQVLGKTQTVNSLTGWGRLRAGGLPGLAIGTGDAFPIRFFTNDTGRMEITGAGLVGIGVTDPDTMLEVFGATGLKISFDATDNTTLVTDTNGDLTISPSGGDVLVAGDITALGSGATGLILYDTTLEGYYRVTLDNGVLVITSV